MDARIDFGILLGLAYFAFAEELNASLREDGFEVGPSFGYVFRAAAEGPLTLTDLASRLDMTTQGAAKIIRAMEEAGCVSREPDPDDARAKRIALTERGRETLAAARRFHQDFEARLAEQLGAAQVEGVREVLTRMVAARSGDGIQRPFRPL